MPAKNLLKQHGLARNPFTDRTAENTELDALSLYEHSDLQHFKPSNETYVFFGKRGSGKTTIRMAMQRAYERANEQLEIEGLPQHFVVDLCSPGHMTACLKDFQARSRSHSCNNSFNPSIMVTLLAHTSLQRLGTMHNVLWQCRFVIMHLLVSHARCVWHFHTLNAVGKHWQCRGELGRSIQAQLDSQRSGRLHLLIRHWQNCRGADS